jgi:hypothetical protein
LLAAAVVVQELAGAALAAIYQEQQTLAFRRIQLLLVLVVRAALLPHAIVVAIHLFLDLLLPVVAVVERLVPRKIAMA